MNCAPKTVKRMLHFFNFIFVLCGIGLLVPGILSLAWLGYVGDEFLDTKLNIPGIMSISTGVVLLAVCAFGCCGAMKESRLLITTYSILLILIVLVEVAVSVTAFIYGNDTDGISGDQLLEYVQNYTVYETEQAAINTLQQNLDCCGANLYTDYGSDTLPLTCCASSNPCLTSSGDLYTEGCTSVLTDLISFLGEFVGAMAVGIAAIQIIGVSFVWCFVSCI